MKGRGRKVPGCVNTGVLHKIMVTLTKVIITDWHSCVYLCKVLRMDKTVNLCNVIR